MKSEYEVKIKNFDDNYARVSRENEALKERIDILFKLGKSYVEANNIQLSHETLDSGDTTVSVSNTQPNKDNDIIEIVSDETADTSWNSNRLRGFRRKNHNVTNQVNTTDHSKNPENNEVTTQSPNEEVKSQHYVRSNPTNNSPDQSNNSRPRYCHYFSNFGNCEFEEKSGLKCKFLHERAPMCNAGLNCSKMKCMYVYEVYVCVCTDYRQLKRQMWGWSLEVFFSSRMKIYKVLCVSQKKEYCYRFKSGVEVVILCP